MGKKGVVREPEIHIEVIENVFEFTLAKGFKIINLDYSPIRGPEGNIEYLMHIVKSELCEDGFDARAVVMSEYKTKIDETVAAAHNVL